MANMVLLAAGVFATLLVVAGATLATRGVLLNDAAAFFHKLSNAGPVPVSVNYHFTRRCNSKAFRLFIPGTSC